MTSSKWFFRKFKGFFVNKRAVSVALSTMIITAGVIAAGIAVLYWTYSWGNVADQQYSQSVNSNSLAMQENIGFEYTIYNSENNQLTLYIINSGLSNITLNRLYLWNSANQLIGGTSYPITKPDVAERN